MALAQRVAAVQQLRLLQQVQQPVAQHRPLLAADIVLRHLLQPGGGPPAVTQQLLQHLHQGTRVLTSALAGLASRCAMQSTLHINLNQLTSPATCHMLPSAGDPRHHSSSATPADTAHMAMRPCDVAI